MTDSRALYQEVILDHTKNPRNFREITPCDHKVEGYNPLCGDHLTVFITMEDDLIQDIAFTGQGCAISKSSASLMTTVLKGKTIKEARTLFNHFHHMVTSELDEPIEETALGKLRVFSGIREFPVRIKCATLAWHALNTAFETTETTISTE